MIVRPYREGDERGLVGLFEAAFGQTITEEHWRWKLKGRTSPVPNVWLAIAGDRPVFQCAGIPTPFLLAGMTVTAMVAVDAMTAPEFRRRGLLTQVNREGYAAWRDGGIAFVLGLPNEQWGSSAAAVGYQPLFPLEWMTRPLLPEAILARRLRLPPLRRAGFVGDFWNRVLSGRLKRDPAVQTEHVDIAGEEFDQIWAGSKSGAMFSTVRDREWVNWRFLRSPMRKYVVMLARRGRVPVGYLAYRMVDTAEKVAAHLAEIVVVGEDRGGRDTLLEDLLNELRVLKAESLVALAVPGTPGHRWFRGVGFLSGPPFSVQIVPLSPDLPIEPMRNPNNWRLTGGDFDVL